MKKILITTTILAAMTAATAMAEVEATSLTNGPSVTAGGLIDFQAGNRHQKVAYKATPLSPGQKNVRFENYAQAYLKVLGKSDIGFTYGAVVALQTGARGYNGSESGKFDSTFLFIETDLGKLELGSNESASASMKVGASSIARATGGIAGDFADYANLSVNGASYLYPDLASDYRTNREKSRKITYYTPRYSGLQFGLSYTPDATVLGDSVPAYNGTVAGTATALSSIASHDIKDVFSGGLNYSEQFDQVAVKASLLGETATKQLDLNKTFSKARLQSWAIGASIDYAGFSVAGSYGQTDKKFLLAKNQQVINAATWKNINYWTAGAAYVQGPIGVSVTYLDSSALKNKFTNLVVGADYQLAPGFTPYVEASMFSEKSVYPTTGTAYTPKNNGQVYIVGTELRF